METEIYCELRDELNAVIRDWCERHEHFVKDTVALNLDVSVNNSMYGPTDRIGFIIPTTRVDISCTIYKKPD